MMTKFPDLTIEQAGDDCLHLTQYHDGESQTVSVHTAQIRYIAEMLGLIEGRIKRVDTVASASSSPSAQLQEAY